MCLCRLTATLEAQLGLQRCCCKVRERSKSMCSPLCHKIGRMDLSTGMSRVSCHVRTFEVVLCRLRARGGFEVSGNWTSLRIQQVSIWRHLVTSPMAQQGVRVCVLGEPSQDISSVSVVTASGLSSSGCGSMIREDGTVCVQFDAACFKTESLVYKIQFKY